MNENNIVSYSFMSALLASGSDIYTYVYLPLVKRAVSKAAKEGNTKMTCSDLIYSMEQLYGLAVPERVAEKLLMLVEKKSSRKNKSDYELSYDKKNKELLFKGYSYQEKESIYDKERRNVSNLQFEFDKFINKDYPELVDCPSFSEFIDQNKRALSVFFSGKKTTLPEQTDKSFLPHVQFLKHIEKYDDRLYKTAKNIYLGTLMATYLEDEIDLGQKVQEKTKFFFDTQLILEALDLQEPDRTKPTKDLIRLIQGSKNYIKILDVTLDEIRNILNKSIERFSTEGADKVVDACKRNSRSISWLTKLSANIETRIKNELQIEVVPCSNAEKEAFLSTEEYRKLSERWTKGSRAKHDAIAYMYVRARRSNNNTNIQKAGYWFVAANEDLYNFNAEERPCIGLPEIATPGFLTGILFISNPSKIANTVSHLMLSESIAQVMTIETPSIDMIMEFEKSVRQSDAISEDEYVLLRDALSSKSCKTLRQILSDKQTLPDITRQMIETSRARMDENEKLQKLLSAKEVKTKILVSVIILLIGIVCLLCYQQFFTPSPLGICIILTFSIVVVVLYWVWRYLNRLIKIIIKAVMTAGGLWGFGNFIINLYKLARENQWIASIIGVLKNIF